MIVKRLIDLLGATFGLVLLAPLFLLIGLCIKLDSPGPVIFRQERVGRHGKTFLIWKFRSMQVSSSPGPLVTVAADARITKVGRYIRRYKLDELPQLVNVLLGDMSLVGPRPEVAKYVALYSAEQRRKVLSVSPGITDPASILFINESEVLGRYADPESAYVHEILPKKLQIYEEYVQNRTLVGDICILLRTLLAAVIGSSMSHRR